MADRADARGAAGHPLRPGLTTDALQHDLWRLQHDEEADDAFLDWCDANEMGPDDRDARRAGEQLQQQRLAEWRAEKDEHDALE